MIYERDTCSLVRLSIELYLYMILCKILSSHFFRYRTARVKIILFVSDGLIQHTLFLLRNFFFLFRESCFAMPLGIIIDALFMESDKGAIDYEYMK